MAFSQIEQDMKRMAALEEAKSKNLTTKFSRDMNLVRNVLSAYENGEQSSLYNRFDEDTVKYHLRMMIDAKLLYGSYEIQVGQIVPNVEGITWKGHDLLEKLKKD